MQNIHYPPHLSQVPLGEVGDALPELRSPDAEGSNSHRGYHTQYPT